MIDVPTAAALNVKPGQKLCLRCEQQAHAGKETTSDDELYHPAVSAEDLNVTASELGCSPLKLTKLSQRDKASYAKRKLSQITDAAKSKVSQILNVSTDILDSRDDASCDKCRLGYPCKGADRKM